MFNTIHVAISVNPGSPQVPASTHLTVANLHFRVKNPLPFSPTSIFLDFLDSLYGTETEALDTTRVEDPNQPTVDQNILRNYACLGCLGGTFQLQVFDFFVNAQQQLEIPFIGVMQMQRRSFPNTFMTPSRIQFLEVRGTDGRGVRTFGQVPLPTSTPEPTPVAIASGFSSYELNRSQVEVEIINLRPGNFQFVVKPRTALSRISGVVPFSATPVPVLSGGWGGPFKEGDFNGDDKIDALDFSGLLGEFGKAPGYEPMSFLPISRADFNQDGAVTIRDFALLAANYNQAGITLTPTPTPTP